MNDEDISTYYFMDCFPDEDSARITRSPSLHPPLDNWYHGIMWNVPIPEPLIFEIDNEDQGVMLSYFNQFPLMVG